MGDKKHTRARLLGYACRCVGAGSCVFLLPPHQRGLHGYTQPHKTLSSIGLGGVTLLNKRVTPGLQGYTIKKFKRRTESHTGRRQRARETVLAVRSTP